MTLYDDLGVRPDATDAEIKAAYRKQAKKAHPDAPGGSREKFDRLSTALAVLTDKGRRDQYDRTGQAEAPQADTREGKAKQLAFTQLCTVFGEIEKRGGRVEEQDVLALAITGLRDQIGQLSEQLRQAETDEKKARKIAKKFHAKKGKQNFIGMMLEARANDIVTRQLQLKQDKELAEAAIKVLQDHTFDRETPDPWRDGASPFGGFFQVEMRGT